METANWSDRGGPSGLFGGESAGGGERGTQRAGAAPFKLAMAMGTLDRRASNRTWRNRGAVAHDGGGEGSAEATRRLAGEERGS